MQTKKEMNHEILNIGVPSFLETLFTTFASIIDSKMVSGLGVSAISAVAVTNQPRLFIFALFFALNTVTSSLVARNYGKNDRDEANRVLDHVLKLTVIACIVLSVLCVVLARPIMILFANQKDTLEHSIIYYQVLMGGMFFNLFYMTINSAFRGFGKTKLTFTSNVISCLVNILFDYLLIEGHLGFPRLEYVGAALATVFGNVVASAVVLVFALKEDRFVNLRYCRRKRFKMTRASLAEINSMAKSCVTDNIAMRFSLLLISGIVARIGSFQMAVYSVGMHLLNVNMALGTGLQTAGVATVGRCYGAGDVQGMHAYKKQIIKMGTGIALILGAVIIAGGRWFFCFFSTDETFITMGMYSAFFIGAITLSQTLKFAYVGCLQGVGEMKKVMIASIVSFGGVNLTTLAILILVFKVGLWGVWISSLTAQTVQAVMAYIFIKKSDAFKNTQEV